MNFYINSYRGRHGDSFSEKKQYPYVELTTDDWDDFFEYQTLFRATYYNFDEETIHLGEIKIGTKKSKVTREVIEKKFTKLNREFCSLGQSVDYYENLNKINNRKNINDIINSLNDIAFVDNIFEEFTRSDSGLIYNSLLRFSEAKKAYYEATDIIYKKDIKKSFDFTFRTKIDSFSNYHEVKFDFNSYNKLPNRINILVGNNGTGKTTLLANLANELSGITKGEKTTSEIEGRPSFSRVIAISYSAFDNFNKSFMGNNSNLILNYVKRTKSIIPKSINELKGNIDMVNLLELLEENIDMIIESEYFNKINNSEKEGRAFSYVYCGILNNDGMISTYEIYNNFLYRLQGLIDKDRFDSFYDSLAEIIDDKDILKGLLETRTIKEIDFERLSSGQASIIFVLTSIIYNIEEESLLIFDEPEIHLHPNAISSLMRMINNIVEDYKAYAIIATHSPLIVQEIPSRYVRVLNRFENKLPVINEVEEEYFGDNITNIVNEIFQVKDNESNYKTIIKRLQQENYSKEEIFDMFNNNLSFNSNIYINTIFKEEENE